MKRFTMVAPAQALLTDSTRYSEFIGTSIGGLRHDENSRTRLNLISQILLMQKNDSITFQDHKKKIF